MAKPGKKVIFRHVAVQIIGARNKGQKTKRICRDFNLTKDEINFVFERHAKSTFNGFKIANDEDVREPIDELLQKVWVKA